LHSVITVELHLFGLIGTARHTDSLNSLHWQFEVEKNSTNNYFRLPTYLHKKH